ncbi:MAG TPA: hypothetical protein VJM13_12470 [Sphingopyxis sp.]|nr:hypothetical protein [Sphingopyxis sp.]
MTIEQHIEELRAELSWCYDAAERAQIEAELEAAKALLVAREAAIEAHRG